MKPNWRPITTLPDHNTRILMLNKNNQTYPMISGYYVKDGVDFQWYDYNHMGVKTGNNDFPTHWCYLSEIV